ncbi:hypothetical protein KP509_31G064400 [Ceratopteris richardii]|nr:hypothetical protein KP509_31G064400 [Ceratopteris richardii]
MEQIIGVGASVMGDMASRPNFGLNELDFVFSTLVVGSILNFSLMYMLASTSAEAAAANVLPSIFSSCPPGHMFEQGAYTMLDRLGTFVYKGAVFAAVGFGAGLFGTFMSNTLIGFRKKMEPSFEPQNKAPPTLLNAATWSIHMGLSSNLRYQLINGLESVMINVLPSAAFKVSVFCLRGFNNLLGGFSFVTLARLTGSQKKAEAKVISARTTAWTGTSEQKDEDSGKRDEGNVNEDGYMVGKSDPSKAKDVKSAGTTTD